MQKTQIQGVYKVREGVLVNNDTLSLKNYKARKKKDNLINELDARVQYLEEELEDLKRKINNVIS